MAEDGHPYRGVLYAGLMIANDGPKVIEFNCRFGDPETQVVLPRMKSDLLPLLDACTHGGLHGSRVQWHDQACVTVVMASCGYPGKFEKGKTITGVETAEEHEETLVFHAGTRRDGDRLVTNGGRVLNVTATGPDIRAAIDHAYRAAACIHFDSAHFRRDIGRRALAHLAV
jgi:phosphoribosylamine--glycine ligase